MTRSKSTGMSDKASDIILVTICTVVLLIVAYPLYYVLVASFSDPYDVYAGKTFLLPSGFTFDGYKAVFADPKIVSGFLNSVKYTVIGTIFSVVMLYITAYPLAQKDLPGRKWISLFFVFTMYFGGGLVPTYLVVRDTGLMGSMWALFLPGGVGVGNMIIVRNYFQNSMLYDGELQEKAFTLFIENLEITKKHYTFNQAEADAAPLLYRYLRPFWWYTVRAVETSRKDAAKIERVLAWMEVEQARKLEL